MLLKCWFTVFDAGPTFKQHLMNALLLLGDQLSQLFMSYALCIAGYILKTDVIIQSTFQGDCCNEKNLVNNADVKYIHIYLTFIPSPQA